MPPRTRRLDDQGNWVTFGEDGFWYTEEPDEDGDYRRVDDEGHWQYQDEPESGWWYDENPDSQDRYWRAHAERGWQWQPANNLDDHWYWTVEDVEPQESWRETPEGTAQYLAEDGYWYDERTDDDGIQWRQDAGDRWQCLRNGTWEDWGEEPVLVAQGTEGFLGKDRSPASVLGLSIVTLGIYYLVWYYKINNEIRQHDPDITVAPGWAVAAISLGAILFIPPLVSAYTTAARIRQMQLDDGATQTISPIVALLLHIFLGIGYPLYISSQLREHWHGHRRELRSAG